MLSAGPNTDLSDRQQDYSELISPSNGQPESSAISQYRQGVLSPQAAAQVCSHVPSFTEPRVLAQTVPCKAPWGLIHKCWSKQFHLCVNFFFSHPEKTLEKICPFEPLMS